MSPSCSRLVLDSRSGSFTRCSRKAKRAEGEAGRMSLTRIMRKKTEWRSTNAKTTGVSHILGGPVKASPAQRYHGGERVTRQQPGSYLGRYLGRCKPANLTGRDITTS